MTRGVPARPVCCPPERAGSSGRLLGPVAVERGVGAAGSDQLVVRALLRDAAVVEHDDVACLADRRQAVRDDDRRPACEQPAQPLLDPPLGVEVHVGSRLVEDQDSRVGDQRARERHELALTG